ncbi:MAG: hypothetical protein DCC67_06450 [Planctomycetota bacterium]|nr:MAG: hypothetical protein DCC67_06450 [Planctomycetota bacterium]
MATAGVLAAVGAGTARAQTEAVTSGNWLNAGTWSAGVPSDTLHAYINGGHTVTIDQIGPITNQVDVGTATGESGTLTINSGDLTITDPNAAEPNLPSIRIGQAAGSTGTFNMNGGSVFIDGASGSGFAVGDLLVGDNGNATMTMTGGQLQANDEIIFGTQNTSTATVNISGGNLQTLGRSILVGFAGNATLNVSNEANVVANWDLLVGFVEGSTATINQSGGTIEAGFLFTNSFTGGAGSTVNMNMTGGTFNARIAFVLGQGNGTTTMTHSGGVVNANTPDSNGDVVVGDGDGNTSVYNISGTATVNALHSVLVGVFEDPNDPEGAPAANGTVNQTGGVINAGVALAEGRDGLIIGRDGVGTWNLNAGTINAGNVFLGDFDSSQGTLKVTGGALNLGGNLNVGAALASNAPGDDVRVEPGPDPIGPQGQALDANGTLIIQGTGGDINVAGNLLANPDDKSAFRNGPGQENDSLLRFTLGSTGISPIDVALKADLDGAVIDIDDSAGFFNLNPAATLTLISAVGGFGNVHTVTAAEQAGNGKGFTLAAGDASAFDVQIVPRPGGGEMMVVKKGTIGLPSDFDNDGDVDGNDFLLIQRGFGTTTGPSDIAAWKTNFGTTAATSAVGAVPEPGAVLLAIGAACGGLLLRRRS